MKKYIVQEARHPSLCFSVLTPFICGIAKYYGEIEHDIGPVWGDVHWSIPLATSCCTRYHLMTLTS
jgi:hypothetical protein